MCAGEGVQPAVSKYYTSLEAFHTRALWPARHVVRSSYRVFKAVANRLWRQQNS